MAAPKPNDVAVLRNCLRSTEIMDAASKGAWPSEGRLAGLGGGTAANGCYFRAATDF
jgi:hypothetical protein